MATKYRILSWFEMEYRRYWSDCGWSATAFKTYSKGRAYEVCKQMTAESSNKDFCPLVEEITV